MKAKTYDSAPKSGTLIADRLFDNFDDLPPIMRTRMAALLNAAGKLAAVAVDGRKENRRLAVAQFKAARRDVTALLRVEE